MALTNIFSSLFKPKQPVQQPVLQSKAPQASYAPNMSTNKGPVYASPAPTPLRTSSANAYSAAPKITTPKPTPPKPTYVPTNPVAKFGQQASQGQGITALQNLMKPPQVAGASASLRSTMPTVNKTSMSSNTSMATPYPMASMADGGVKYSDGSVKYPNGKVNPQAPTTTPTPTAEVKTNAGGEKTMADLWAEQIGMNKNIAQGQLDYGKKVTDETVGNIRTSYDAQIKNVLDQLPFLEQMNESEKSELLAAVEDLKKAGALNKDNINAEFDRSLKQAAQSKRTTDAQRQNTFAALGTLDSGGAMGFTGQQQNADEEFLSNQQETLRQRANKISTLEIDLSTAERKAKKLITEQSLKFNEAVRAIKADATLMGNEKEAAIRQKYLEFEGQAKGIQDQLAQMQYNVEVEKTNYAQQMKLMEEQSKGPNLSESFIATGQPSTREDFIYRTAHPEAFEGKLGAGAQQTQEKQGMIDLIDKLSGGDIGAITGIVKTGWVPGSQGALTKNYFDQLKGMLSLENRAKMKGSGAISDFEAKTLDRAASALGTNLSEDQFRAVLNDLRTNLGGGAQTANANDPLGLGIL